MERPYIEIHPTSSNNPAWKNNAINEPKRDVNKRKEVLGLIEVVRFDDVNAKETSTFGQRHVASRCIGQTFRFVEGCAITVQSLWVGCA